MASRSRHPVLRRPWKTTRRNCSTSRWTSSWTAWAVFFLRRQGFLDRARPADSFVHLQQVLIELPKAMKCFHLALRLAPFGRRGEALANRLSIYLAGQTKVWAVARLAGPMTATIEFSAAAINRGDGAGAKIAQVKNLRQDVGALMFESAQGIRQVCPPVRTYAYVRIITAKKEKLQNPPKRVAHPIIWDCLQSNPSSAILKQICDFCLRTLLNC